MGFGTCQCECSGWLSARALTLFNFWGEICCSSGIEMFHLLFCWSLRVLPLLCADFYLLWLTRGRKWVNWNIKWLLLNKTPFRCSFPSHMSFFWKHPKACCLIFRSLLCVKKDLLIFSPIVALSLPATYTSNSVPMATWLVNRGNPHENCLLCLICCGEE